MKFKRLSIILFFYNQQFTVEGCSVGRNASAFFSPWTPTHLTDRIVKIDIFEKYLIAHIFQKEGIVFCILFRFFSDKFYTVFYFIRFTFFKLI